MKIEVWSDYACPFCYIGKRRLEHALEQFPDKDDVEVTFRSFQLDPTADPAGTPDIHAMLARKYGVPYEQAKEMNAQVGEQARGVGLDFRFDTMVHTNTFDSHRLAHYAEEQGAGQAVNERLLKAYFTDSLNLGDRGVLADLAAEAGLDRRAVTEMLESDRYSAEVRADIARAGQIGVKGVPFFVFNDKYALSGAQPGPVFSEVLETVRKEEKEPVLKTLGSDTADGSDGCADGSCSV